MKRIDSRFQEFMSNVPSIEEIDKLDWGGVNPRPKVADYLALGRKVILEQKCISKNQEEKIQKIIEGYENEDYYPAFYGEMDIEKVLDHFPDDNEARRKIFFNATRLIEGYFSQARKQIESTASYFKLEEYVGIIIILNDGVRFFTPEVISSRVQRLFMEKSNDVYKYDKIFAVFYISPKHLYLKSKPVTLLISKKPNSNAELAAKEYMDYLAHAWATYNGAPLEIVEDPLELVGKTSYKETPQECGSRNARRRLAYSKERYLVALTDDELLKKMADHIKHYAHIFDSRGAGVHVEKRGEITLIFQDMIQESNYRGLDLKRLEKFFE